MEVFKGAVALEAPDVINSMTGIIPLVIDLRCRFPMAISAGLHFLFRGELRMLLCPLSVHGGEAADQDNSPDERHYELHNHPPFF